MRSFRFSGLVLGLFAAAVGCQTSRSGMQWCASCGQYHGHVAVAATTPATVASRPPVAPVPPAPPAADLVTPVSSTAVAEPDQIPPAPTVAQ